MTLTADQYILDAGGHIYNPGCLLSLFLVVELQRREVMSWEIILTHTYQKILN